MQDDTDILEIDGLSAPSSFTSQQWDHLATPGPTTTPLNGFVAVLDALGGQHFSYKAVHDFVNLRDWVLKTLRQGAVQQIKMVADNMTEMTINDTVVLAYTRGIEYEDAWAFCHLLRIFQAVFFEHGYY